MSDEPLRRDTRVFISAVSSELRSIRSLVKLALEQNDYHAIEQDSSFPPDYRDLIEKLRERIGSCDAIVHIAGHCYGAEPEQRAEDAPRRSYTQLEYDIAVELGKPVYVFLTGDGFPADSDESEPEEKRRLQAEHRSQLTATGREYNIPESPQELDRKIRSIQLQVERLKNELTMTDQKVGSLLTWFITIGTLLISLLGMIWWNLPPTDPDPEDIRAELRKTVRETYQRDLQNAEHLPKADRAAAFDLAEESRDRSLRRVDRFIDSVVDTYRTGEATLEYRTLMTKVADEGVDMALEYIDQQSPRLFVEASQEVGDVEAMKRNIRRMLHPVLQSVSLLQDKGAHQQAVRRCERLLSNKQGDPTWPEARHEHAWSLIELGDRAKLYETIASSEQYFTAALESARFAAQASAGDTSALRNVSVAYDRLGDATVLAGDLDQALEYFLGSLEIQKKLPSADPTNTGTQRDLSVLYNKLGDVSQRAGDLDQALKYFEKALNIVEKLAVADPTNASVQRDLSVSFERLGDVSQQAGDLDQAFEYFQKALDIADKLAAADPTDPSVQRDLSVSYNKLGELSRQAGDLDQALEYFQEDLDIAVKLAAADPTNASAQRDLSVSYDKLGDVSQRAGDLDQALRYFQKSLDILEKLAAADSNNASAHRDLSVLYNRLGDVSQQAGDLDQALKYFQKSLKIADKLAAADPTNASVQRDVSISFERLGDFSQQVGDLDEALEYFQKSLDIREKLAEADPTNASVQRDLMVSHYKLGGLRGEQFAYAKSKLQYQAGIDVLDQMIASAMFVDQSKKERDILVQQQQVADMRITATAEWDAVLEQSSDLLPTLLSIRCTELAKQGQIDDVAQAASKLRLLEPRNAANLYNAACGFALCASALVAEQDQDQRQIFIEKSLKNLQEAIDSGFDNFKWMSSDPELRSLWNLTKFQRMLTTNDGLLMK